MNATGPSDDDRWAAVEGRDARAEGAFVYAVRTTGIYCRPTCRSRRPNRANVAFFDRPEAAERARLSALQAVRAEGRPARPRPRRAIARACSMLEGRTIPLAWPSWPRRRA